MTPLHLHVQPCPCSACRVARNYARLLAAQALRDEADAPKPFTPEQMVRLAQPERYDLDAVLHDGQTTLLHA